MTGKATVNHQASYRVSLLRKPINGLKQYGPNALQEKKKSTLLQLLSYFWGPIPWMIEIAAVLSASVKHWADFGIIMALLIFNAGVGFWQEFTAGNAVEALKNSYLVEHACCVMANGEKLIHNSLYQAISYASVWAM